MPYGKGSRLKLLKYSGEGVVLEPPDTEHGDVEDGCFEEEGGDVLVKCCSPRPCRAPQVLINRAHPDSAIKVVCNSEECTQSGWMHYECFNGK